MLDPPGFGLKTPLTGLPIGASSSLKDGSCSERFGGGGEGEGTKSCDLFLMMIHSASMLYVMSM